MAINKNKVNDNALKFIQKGQIKKAIREYEKILAEDPSDVRTLLKKGDLLVRVGEKEQAVDTYLLVANAYSQQGFHLKAVAVFKQILKIDDGRIDVNLRLAEEYQNLGIVGDAMSHLQIVAAYYDQQGMIRESLDILRRIVDLDPDNIASRIKLAELYSREEMLQEAVEEFIRAAEELKNANRVEDYIKVAERLIYHDPTNISLIKELANIYLQRGDTKRALGKLQVCFKSDPRDLETLSMLSMAFQELNQLSKTVSVHKEMAKIYQEQGAVSEMQEIYRRILEIAPDDPDANKALSGDTGFTEPVMPDIPVEPSAPAITMPSSDAFGEDETAATMAESDVLEDFGGMQDIGLEPVVEDQMTVETQRPQAQSSSALSEQAREIISRLLTETDVYIKYGLHNKAYEHLNRVFEQDPNNIEAHDKLKDLYVAANQNDHACQELVTLVHLSGRVGRTDDARAYLQHLLTINPAHPDGAGLEAMLNQEAPVSGSVEDGVYPEMDSDGPDVMFADGDGTVEVGTGDALDSVDVTLDFEESGEYAAPAELSDFDDQVTNPAAMPGEAATDVVMLGEGPDALSDAMAAAAGMIELDDESSPGGDFDSPIVTEVVDDDLGDLPGIEDVDELLTGVSSAPEMDLDGDEDDDEEVPTRIADLSDMQFQSLDDAAEQMPAPDPTSLDSNFALGEDTVEIGAAETNVYPPGGPQDAPDLDLGEPQTAPQATVDTMELEAVAPPGMGSPDLEDVEVLAAEDEPMLVDDSEAMQITDEDVVSIEDEASPGGGAEPELIEFDEGEAFFEGDEPSDQAAVVQAPAPSDDFSEGESPTQLFVPDLDAVAAMDLEGPAEADAADASAVESAVATADPAALDEEEPESSELDDGLEEVDFFIQQNLIDEAADALEMLKGEYPDHPQVQELSGRLERLQKGEAPMAQVSPEDLGESFDLAAELEREVGEDLAAAPIDDEFQYSVDDVFSEFKKGVEKVVEKEDSATHFDLGIAYKEMGLLDDAISEFEVASQDEGKRASAIAMIGLCYMEKGQYSDAINRFKDALHQPDISDREATGLYYEMGAVYEKLEDLSEALFYFKKVYKRDSKFRDVTARLKALVKASGGKKGNGADAKSGGKSKASSKDKISYM